MPASPDEDDSAVAPQLPEGIGSMADAVRLVAAKLLDERHYQALHRVLSSKWDRLHSLSAAVKLIEQHGVGLTQEEITNLSTMDEERQINVLVSKMPMQSQEQFQHFFLQLQLLVSTATRIRRGLEAGNSDAVAESLEGVENTGIASDVLRMAVVQAGAEVKLQKQIHEDWAKESDARMSRLIRSMEDAAMVQKKLEAVEAELAKYQMAQLEKQKKFLMSFAANFSAGLLVGCFRGWQDVLKRSKMELEVRADYVECFQEANSKFQAANDRLSLFRNMMTKKGDRMRTELLSDIVEIWIRVAHQEKTGRESMQLVRSLNMKLAAAKSAHIVRAKQFLTGAIAKYDGMLLQVGFQGWINYHEDLQKNLLLEEQVKQQELRMAEYLQGKKASAKKVLSIVDGSTNTGIMTQVIQAWKQALQDLKKEAEIDEAISANMSKLWAFGCRGKAKAMTAMGTARSLVEEELLIKVTNAWRLESRLEVTLRSYHAKIEAKRQQLLGVQQMFRTFAHQLDTRLRGSFESERNSGKRLNKTEGSVSLPDIRKSAAKTATPTKTMPEKRNMQQNSPSGVKRVLAEPAAYPVQQQQAQPRAAWG